MPQSLSKVIVHIIFSTKDREPWLESNVRPRVHAYLAIICRDLGAELVHVGGVADHVHVVTTLPRTIPRLSSSKRLRKHPRNRSKRLMAGIAAFSGNVATARFQ